MVCPGLQLGPGHLDFERGCVIMGISSRLFSTVISKRNGKSQEENHFSRQIRRNRRDFLILAGPALFWFALLMLYPLIRMFAVSTLDWWGIVKPSTFIGFDNYVHMFNDPRFYAALVNTCIQLAVTLPVVMPVAFMLGFFLSQRPPGYRLLRVIIFTPAILSVAAQSMLFVGVYLPDGVLNTVLRGIGLESLTRAWLGGTSTVLGSIIAIEFWGGIGFYAVLFFAALSNVPGELFEAAIIDGANYWTRMWRIAFPLVLDFFGVMLMLQFTWLLLGFSQIVILLTKGGPGNYSLVLGYLLYEQAFRIRRLGYSQAIGVFIFVFGISGMLLIRKATRRNYQL